MKKGTRGFTLIELLVVIAIIAILAAILFPVFTQARAKARQIACLSNVKNLSLAVLMYVDDYDGKFPLCTASTYAGIWPNNVVRYIGAPEILHCPADGNMTPTMGPALSYFVESVSCIGTPPEDLVYFPPNTSGTNGGGVFNCQGRPEAGIPEPGNTIMMGCAQIDPAGPYSPNDDTAGVWSVRTQSIGWQWIGCNIAALCIADPGDKYTSGIYLHGGGSNFGFADGHAKWMKLEKCYYPSNLFCVNQPNPGGPDPFGSLAYYGYGGYMTTPW